MGMLDTIRARRDEVYAIAKRHKTEKFWVFGSCARGESLRTAHTAFSLSFSFASRLSLLPNGLLAHTPKKRCGALVAP